MKKCWICKSKADSYEHKFKASLLRKHFGKRYGEKNPHTYVNGSDETELDSYKSKELKFAKVICQNCNNNLTRSHDDAYDIFSEFIESNFKNLIDDGKIDFKQIFGKDWKKEKANLYRYIAKHAGCKIATGKLPYQIDNLSKFILGANECQSLAINFELKEGIKHLHDFYGLQFPNLFNSHCVYFRKKTENSLNYGGWTSYLWISIVWVVSNRITRSKYINLNRESERINIQYLKNCKPFNPKWKFSEALDNVEYNELESLDKMRNYFEFLIT